MTSKKIFLVNQNVPRDLPDEIRLQRQSREILIVELTKKLGYDCKYFVLSKEKAKLTGDPLTDTYFVPVDDVEANPDGHTSSLLLEEIEREKPDLIIFRFASRQKLTSWLMLRTRHTFRFALIVGGGVGELARPFVDHVFGETSQQLQDMFPKLQKSEKRTTVLPKIPDPAFSAWEGETKKIFDVINIGSFSKRKNQIMLLPLAKRHKIALIGSGPEYGAVKSAAEVFGDNVYMPGNLSPELTAVVLRQSRLMVHTSYREGLPRVFAEAFACGVPVVASHEASPAAFEDGRLGRLVAHKDLLDTAEALLDDPSALSRMSQAARGFAASHQTVQGLESALKSAYLSIFSMEPMWAGSLKQRLLLRLILLPGILQNGLQKIRRSWRAGRL